MASFVSHTTLDCPDAYGLSLWWQGVLDYVEDPDDPNEPGHEERMIVSRDGRHRLLFVEVPERKEVKNRMHLDLRPREWSRDEKLERLVALGAVEVADRRNADGTGWVLLADPEGNEFCILRSEAEVAATRGSSKGTRLDWCLCGSAETRLRLTRSVWCQRTSRAGWAARF